MTGATVAAGGIAANAIAASGDAVEIAQHGFFEGVSRPSLENLERRVGSPKYRASDFGA